MRDFEFENEFDELERNFNVLLFICSLLTGILIGLFVFVFSILFYYE